MNVVNIRLLNCGANSTRDFPLNKIHVTNVYSKLGFVFVFAWLLIDNTKSSHCEERITFAEQLP